MVETPRERRSAPPADGDDGDVSMERDLRRIAHMFSAYRDDPLMRELCRLAIKCTQERLIRV